MKILSLDDSSRSIKLQAAAKTARLKAEMNFFERGNELRRNQLIKDIAIAKAEEQAIKEALKEERQNEIFCRTEIICIS